MFHFLEFCVFLSIMLFIGGLILNLIFVAVLGAGGGLIGIGSWIAKQFNKH